jgi:hypothetical protein
MPELVESKMMWSVQTTAMRAETVVTTAPEEKTSAKYGHEYYKKVQ